jgi:hypothetical protein
MASVDYINVSLSYPFLVFCISPSFSYLPLILGGGNLKDTPYPLAGISQTPRYRHRGSGMAIYNSKYK